MPGASTHVTVYDGGRDPLNVVTSGHGSGEAGALGDLLTALEERHESVEVIAFVSEDYRAVRETRLSDRVTEALG